MKLDRAAFGSAGIRYEVLESGSKGYIPERDGLPTYRRLIEDTILHNKLGFVSTREIYNFIDEFYPWLKHLRPNLHASIRCILSKHFTPLKESQSIRFWTIPQWAKRFESVKFETIRGEIRGNKARSVGIRKTTQYGCSSLHALMGNQEDCAHNLGIPKEAALRSSKYWVCYRPSEYYGMDPMFSL